MKIKITNPNYDCMAYGFELGDILDATIYNSEFYKVTRDGRNYLIHKSTACEHTPTLNLRQLAEDEVVFRFENDDDRKEFFKNIDSITTESSWEIDYVIINNKNGITFYRDKSLVNKYYPTWTEIKEKYNMKKKEIRDLCDTNEKNKMNEIFNEEYIKNRHKETNNELSQAIALLQSNGYKVELPYIQPTESEICERIRVENEKARHFSDWNNLEEGKFFIYFDNNLKDWDYDFKKVVEILGVTYTTQSIAKQIVAELNEKRFVRV